MYAIISGQPSYGRHINLHLSQVEKITSIPLSLWGELGLDCGGFDDRCSKHQEKCLDEILLRNALVYYPEGKLIRQYQKISNFHTKAKTVQP